MQEKDREAVYQCDHLEAEKPPECRHARFLLFKFRYSASKRLSPYGEIGYNYAEMCLDQSSVREGTSSSLKLEFHDADTDTDIRARIDPRRHVRHTRRSSRGFRRGCRCRCRCRRRGMTALRWMRRVALPCGGRAVLRGAARHRIRCELN